MDDVIDFNMPRPNFQMYRINNTPKATQTMVPHSGIEILIMFRVGTN